MRVTATPLHNSQDDGACDLGTNLLAVCWGSAESRLLHTTWCGVISSDIAVRSRLLRYSDRLLVRPSRRHVGTRPHFVVHRTGPWARTPWDGRRRWALCDRAHPSHARKRRTLAGGRMFPYLPSAHGFSVRSTGQNGAPRPPSAH